MNNIVHKSYQPIFFSEPPLVLEEKVRDCESWNFCSEQSL